MPAKEYPPVYGRNAPGPNGEYDSVNEGRDKWNGHIADLDTRAAALEDANVTGDLDYQEAWNASTNTPALTSGVGTKNHYYVVSVAGATNLDGITDWAPGDWAIFNGANWQKIDNSETSTTHSHPEYARILGDPSEGQHFAWSEADGMLVPVAAPSGGGGSGGLLAFVQHNPTQETSYSTTQTAWTPPDGTNLSLTFTAPQSGRALIRLSGSCSGLQWWALLDSANALRTRTGHVMQTASGQLVQAYSHVLSGLSPGTQVTVRWGWRTSASTAWLYVGGSDTGRGPALMEAWAA